MNWIYDPFIPVETRAMKRITISLDDDLHKALQEWAEEDDRSMSSLLSHLSRQALLKRQQDQQLKAS